MTTEQIYDLIKSNNLDKVREIFQLSCDIDTIKTAIKQYKVETHDVFDKVKRPDKPIKDDKGNTVDFKEVHRIAVPLQEQIVLLRSAFIGIPKMDAKPEQEPEKDLIKVMDKVWHDNKLDYRFAETTKRTMSELRCAWLFYNTEEDGYWDGQPINPGVYRTTKPRVKLLSFELGDTLYPVYDGNDDMIAFARGYKTVEFDKDLNKVDVEHLDVYTADRFYFKKKVQGEWVDNYLKDEVLKAEINGENMTTFKPNLVGKIPIIYFAQDKPEWHNVQGACDRIDELISNHADTNDYFGNPILVGIGNSISLPQKGDAGKYVEIGGAGGDLKFVTWDNAPESIKMELTNLFNTAYDLTNTSNISFENMKGIGPMSGFAIQLMFLGATLKAKDCQMSIFGEGVQRAYNYLKKLLSVIDAKFVSTLSFKVAPMFESVLPANDAEVILNISNAIATGIMSEETGIEQNPLLKDADSEKDRIKGEADKKQAAQVAMNNSASGLDSLMNVA
jgi:SPP1 family phage portal protein